MEEEKKKGDSCLYLFVCIIDQTTFRWFFGCGASFKFFSLFRMYVYTQFLIAWDENSDEILPKSVYFDPKIKFCFV